MSRAKKSPEVSATIIRPDGTKIEVKATPDVIADIATKCGGVWPTYTIACSLNGWCMFHGTWHFTPYWPSVYYGGAQTMGAGSSGISAQNAAGSQNMDGHLPSLNQLMAGSGSSHNHQN